MKSALRLAMTDSLCAEARQYVLLTEYFCILLPTHDNAFYGAGWLKAPRHWP
jgi:hypothetical protein